MIDLRLRCAEHAHGTVALELVHPAALGAHPAHHRVEEDVEDGDDLVGRPALGQPRRRHDVDEQHADLASFPSKRDPPLERLARDPGPDVATEQVLQRAPLAQPLDHLVEPDLQQPDLAAVVDRDLHVEVVGPHARERVPDGVDRIGD